MLSSSVCAPTVRRSIRAIVPTAAPVTASGKQADSDSVAPASAETIARRTIRFIEKWLPGRGFGVAATTLDAGDSTAGVVTRHLEHARSFEVTFWRSFFTVVSLLVIPRVWPF